MSLRRSDVIQVMRYKQIVLRGFFLIALKKSILRDRFVKKIETARRKLAFEHNSPHLSLFTRIKKTYFAQNQGIENYRRFVVFR